MSIWLPANPPILSKTRGHVKENAQPAEPSPLQEIQYSLPHAYKQAASCTGAAWHRRCSNWRLNGGSLGLTRGRMACKWLRKAKWHLPADWARSQQMLG